MEDVTILLSFYIWATKKKAVQMTGVLCDEKIQKLVAQTLEWEDMTFWSVRSYDSDRYNCHVAVGSNLSNFFAFSF